MSMVERLQVKSRSPFEIYHILNNLEKTPNTIVEAVVEQFKDENKTEESNVLKVEEIEYKGKIYYLDINNNDIYDPESSELVGKREQGKINIKC